MTDRLPTGLAKSWDGDPGETGRGPRPSASLNAVIDAAIELGDRDGVAGMSLARIAQRLKFTPNALYRYVESRDELHVLVRERALGAPPEPMGQSWRADITGWADAVLARYTEHPWLLDLAVRLPIGPAALGWLEALLRAIEPLQLDEPTRLRVATLVDGYVRACAGLMRDLAGGGDVLDPSVGTFLAPRIADRGLDRVSALMATGAFAPAGEGIEDDYRFGLECILDGIAARVER